MRAGDADHGRRQRIESLKRELDELLKSRPAHSLSPSMALRIEAVEDEIADLEKSETDGASSD
jgi:hypothetical protein